MTPAPRSWLQTVALAILFLFALSVALFALTAFLAMAVVFLLAALLAFVLAPNETKTFVAGARETIDDWVKAMVTLVTQAGETVQTWMRRTAPQTPEPGVTEAETKEKESASPEATRTADGAGGKDASGR